MASKRAAERKAKTVSKSCQWCGNSFMTVKKQQRFCSNSCKVMECVARKQRVHSLIGKECKTTGEYAALLKELRGLIRGA